MTKLAKLEELKDLRQIWTDEARDFTPWLANGDNLSLLKDALEIGFEFSNIRREYQIGKYSADIVADLIDDENKVISKVIIENQLGATDHKHLGQLITYASAFDENVSFILWVTTKCNEEHQQAIDWLNKNTNEKINFFLIQVEVYKIGTSDPAPKFNIICAPNKWSEIVKNYYSGDKKSEVQLLELEYWKQIDQKANQFNLIFKGRPGPRRFYDLAIEGTNEAHIALTADIQKNLIGCEVYIRDNKELFSNLQSSKDEIEKKLNKSLYWQNDLPKAARIRIAIEKDFYSKESWDELHQWHIETANAFAEVFQPYLSGD